MLLSTPFTIRGWSSWGWLRCIKKRSGRITRSFIIFIESQAFSYVLCREKLILLIFVWIWWNVVWIGFYGVFSAFSIFSPLFSAFFYFFPNFLDSFRFFSSFVPSFDSFRFLADFFRLFSIFFRTYRTFPRFIDIITALNNGTLSLLLLKRVSTNYLLAAFQCSLQLL